MRLFLLISRNLATLLLAALMATSAIAENLMEEIVVTAALREESTMDTAASVSITTEAVIRSRAAQHFEDIVHAMANVNYASGSNRARYFQIRGIGERSQFVNPINPSVGFLIDDVDFSGAGTIATLMDVKQVEVLRGPQGTRYGANALGGLISVTTNEPTPRFGASLKLSAAEHGTETMGLVLNTPITESLNARFVVESHESDGYIDNAYLDRDDTNGRDELTVRGKLAWQVRPNWSLQLSLADIDIDNGYDAFSLDNTRVTLSDEPGFDRQASSYLSLVSNAQLQAVDVELLFNRAISDMDYGYDEDWSYTGIHPWGYTSTDHYLRERDTFSFEVRLLSNDSSRIFNDSTDWVVGIYYLDSEEALQRQYTFAAADFFSDYDFDTMALFTQLDTALTDQLTLSTGLRFEERSTKYRDSNSVSFTPSDSLWGGRLALEYQPGQNSLAYLSVSRGYKAGGFNTDGTLDADLREFEDESLIEYEIGYKSILLDGDLALQLAAFYDDRRDQQVKSSLVRVRADGSTEFIDFFGNAASGTNRGVEIDMNWHLTDVLALNANVGWLRAEFDDFVNEFGEDLSGRDQAHAPRYMYSVALNYASGPWSASVSADGKDEYFFSDRHAVKSDRYTLYNASVAYEAENWKLTLWGRNLTDKDYFVRAFGSFGNDPRKFYATEPYFQYGEPRISGITLEIKTGNP